MRAFLEEYGRVIIIIVCVAALLGIVAIFKLKGFSLADSSLGAFVRNANSAINELEDANAYSVKMPKSTTAEIKSSGGNLAKVKAGETITIGTGYTNSEQTITIASLSEQTPGNATAADILAGKTVWVNGVQITGTMPNKGNITGDIIKANAFPAGYYSGISVTKKGAATYVPGTTDQTIADNQFLTGVQTIKGDGNLVAANIAKGKTIFGITGTFGSDTDATAADVLQGKTVYINGQKVTGTLNPTNYSSDATASADKILQGWTAYVNGKKITGTIPSLSATTVTPSASDQKVAGKRYLAGDITIKGDSNLKPENIRTGVSIYSVNGTYTSDATADAKKIMSGYTAYVNGKKITGTATAADFTQDGNAGAKQILSGYTAYVKGKKITGTLTVKDFTNDATATAADVLVGKTAYGKDGKITGTLTTTSLTNDATATAADILSGKTAYVKGTKVIGTIESRTNYTVVGVTGNNNTGVGVGTSSIPDTINLGIDKAAKFASGYYPKGFTVNNSVINKGALNQNLNPGGSVTLAAGYYTGGTIKANSMSGTYTYPANSTGGTVDMGVNNTYRYVNASNVYNKGKADGVASTSGTATAAQILSGYTAWVNGSKITGSMPNRDASTQVANNKAWHYNNRIYFGIDYGYYPAASFGSMNNVSEKYITYDALARDIGIDANKMLSGYSVLGVNGNIPSRSNGEAVYATGVDSHGPYAYVPYGSYPSSSYRPGYSYVYLTEAQVRNYDSDIIAGNIKKGVNILGITGTYEGGAVLTGDIKAEDETINLNAPFVGHSEYGSSFSGSGTTWVYFPKDTYWLIRLSCGCSKGHRNGSSTADPWVTDSHDYSEYKLTVHDGTDRVIAHESGAYDHNGSYFVFMKAGSSAEIFMRGDGGNHNGAAASATRIYSN